jgi:uncharacterized protein YbjT (DUF2867 family)
LRLRGVDVVAASPRHGVDAVTGRGLARALEDAQVVVDVSNSPSLDGAAPLRFFEASGRTLAAAARAAGVAHYLALSVVGTDRLLASSYFQAKKLQEELIMSSGLAYSLLRSTQFFEFIAGVVQEGAVGDVAISPAQSQPISAQDVAEALADLAVGAPLNATMEIAGPERLRLSDVAAQVMTAYEDGRRLIADRAAPYFNAVLDDDSLLPGPSARIGALCFEDWLRDTLQPAGASGRN